MINWKVRVKNKQFWIAIIPAVLLQAQKVLALFGVPMDFGGISDQLIAIVEAVFVVLAILGIVTDPTTAGVGDSTLAMTYEIPKPAGANDQQEDA